MIHQINCCIPGTPKNLFQSVQIANGYPFTEHCSPPNNDAGQGAYLSFATNNPAITFPGYYCFKQASTGQIAIPMLVTQWMINQLLKQKMVLP
jgi:hypothetical protein